MNHTAALVLNNFFLVVL